MSNKDKKQLEKIANLIASDENYQALVEIERFERNFRKWAVGIN